MNHRSLFASALFVACVCLCLSITPNTHADSSAAPRSDGRILHVNFENYVDGVVQPLNAGVRWLGDPFSNRDEGVVEITSAYGFTGQRCAHIASGRPDQIARIRLQKRFDAPCVNVETVFECMFRAVHGQPVDIDDLTLWRTASSDREGVGLTLLANGSAEEGTYRVDVRYRDRLTGEVVRRDGVVDGIEQCEWIQIIQHRKKNEGVVELWLGMPGQTRRVGSFGDLSRDRHLFTIEIGDTSTKTCTGSGFWDDIRVGGLLSQSGSLAPSEPPLLDVGKEAPVLGLPIVVTGERQLFVDDAIVESTVGLQRNLHPVEKHPANPLIVPDRPWEGQSVLLYGAVIYDPDVDRFRAWYLAWGKHIGQSSFICYAESKDGLQWEKPNLGLHPFDGSDETNIVIPNVTSNTTVLYDPRDPNPSHRYKAVIRGGGTRGYVSPDGIHWRDCGAIMDQAYDSTTVHWDPRGEKWMASVKIFRDGKRARGYAESMNFFDWSDTYFMATIDDRDAEGDQMYAMVVFHYETVYLGLLRLFHTATNKIDIELASSRNAKRWDRPLRERFIPTDPRKGRWDYGNNAPSTAPPVRVGDELWFYYSGRSTLHDEVPNTGAIGLGTLRRDGFISMDAGAESGLLTTKPVRLEGETLYLNADATDGEIRVELLDGTGNAVEPFTRENCQPLQGDSLRHAVRWRCDPETAISPDGTLRIRFHIKNAELYAFWTE